MELVVDYLILAHRRENGRKFIHIVSKVYQFDGKSLPDDQGWEAAKNRPLETSSPCLF